MRSLISIALLVLFFALPASADRPAVWRVCDTFLSLAATDDDTPVAIAPQGGAKLRRAGCYTDADAVTPAQLSFEDQDANATTGTVTCGENGVDEVTFTTMTLGHYFAEGEAILFDIDNGSDTQDYVVCVDLLVRE